MVAPEWEQAEALFLAACRRRSANTARAYAAALKALRAFTGKPWCAVTRADAEGWAAHLYESGLSDATINARLAAAESFWDFCIERLQLAERNPFAGVVRQTVTRFGKSRPLEPDQAALLLAQPDRATAIGCRDYAMLLLGLLTGRRSNEIRQLRWGDIDSQFYHWQGKRSTARRDALPAPVWAAIATYLNLSGRQPKPEDPVFVSERYQHRPLSSVWFNDMVRGYAEHAGLPAWVHAHTLRHTAARLRQLCGDDLLTISRLLGHAEARTTQIYLSTMTADDPGWRAVMDLLSSSKEKPQLPNLTGNIAPGGALPEIQADL